MHGWFFFQEYSMSRNNPYRLLLINPWIYDFTAFDLWSKPIGLLYVASYLRELGYEIDYVDCLDKNHPALLDAFPESRIKVKKYGTGPFLKEPVEKPDIFNFIPRHYSRYGLPENIFKKIVKNINKPDVVFVTSFMTYWYSGPRHVIKLIRKIYPGVPVVLGGIYATLMPEHARKVLLPDYLITGPGEVKAAELLRSILPDAPFPDPDIKRLDDFPYPAFDLYHQLDYLPVMTSRGCPYHCTFCATDKVSGPYAQRDPELVFREIKTNVQKYKVRDIAFYDDALLLNRENRIIPLLEKIVQHQLKLRFHTPNGLHARHINGEVAKLFFLAGFKTIRLSFETASNERLTDMNFKITPDQLNNAIDHLESAGYQRKAIESYVMMGLPGQSWEEVYESIFFVHSLGVKIRLASFSPIPGTTDYERAVKEGFFPENANPLLTNKTIYPMHRSLKSYQKFNEIRQLVNVLNYAVDREVNLFSSREVNKSLKRTLESHQ
jgi:radical SAM superfamily enzyme YgiQ (UPF0313 family)